MVPIPNLIKLSSDSNFIQGFVAAPVRCISLFAYFSGEGGGQKLFSVNRDRLKYKTESKVRNKFFSFSDFLPFRGNFEPVLALFGYFVGWGGF